MASYRNRREKVIGTRFFEFQRPSAAQEAGPMTCTPQAENQEDLARGRTGRSSASPADLIEESPSEKPDEHPVPVGAVVRPVRE